YIGGSNPDSGYSIAVDGSGSAYVTGHTQSTEASFPVSVGPDLTYNGGDWPGDTFVAKVAADGTGLDYAGYIGGSSYDQGYGIAVDGFGSAYVTGATCSSEASFPVSGGPDLTKNGSCDAFVAKVKADGTALDYAGYIGGQDFETGKDIAVDGSGSAYVAGRTHSSEASFPVSGGPDLTYNGLADAFVAKVADDLDTDGDGCTDSEELGNNEKLGGRRDPLYFWDFYDATGPAGRDGKIDLMNDIFGVAFRFGATGNPSGDPLTVPPPHPAYHTAFDRGGVIPEGNPWDLLPADGNIDLMNDIFGVAFSFGHNCTS
ncbi:hypothetical protein LCGC14_2738260, partial [marine sediment metagenome]